MKKAHVMDILTNKEAARVLGVYESTITRMAETVPVKHREKLLAACQGKFKLMQGGLVLVKKRLKQLEKSL